MEWREFIIRGIEAIVSWPVAALVLAFGFRNHLRTLVNLVNDPSLTRAKVGSLLDLGWERTAERAREGLEEADETLAKEASASPKSAESRETVPVTVRRKVIRAVGRRQYPGYITETRQVDRRVHESLLQVMSAMQTLAQALSSSYERPSDEGDPDPRSRYTAILDALEGSLRGGLLKTLHELLQLYDLSLDNGATESEALEFVDLATATTKRLKNLAIAKGANIDRS